MIFVLLSIFSSLSLATSFEINTINNKQISVQSSDFGSHMRVVVEKDGEKYYYSLNKDQEVLPAQLGNGLYTVKILKNISGTRYKVLNTSRIELNSDQAYSYLSSSQPVYWEEDGLKNLAKLLMKDKISDQEKVKAAHKYVTENIVYDFNKINVIDNSYVPNISASIDSKKGICYDYSALFAGLLRSQGIPTKLVKGYGNLSNKYHAWNEVYVNSKWELIDTTYDAAAFKVGISMEMYKNNKDYLKVREY